MEAKPDSPKLISKFYNMNTWKMLGLFWGFFCLQGPFFFFFFFFSGQCSLTKAFFWKHFSREAPLQQLLLQICDKRCIQQGLAHSAQMGTAKALQFYHELQNTWREKRCSCKEHQHKRSFISWGHEDLRFDQDGEKKRQVSRHNSGEKSLKPEGKVIQIFMDWWPRRRNLWWIITWFDPSLGFWSVPLVTTFWGELTRPLQKFLDQQKAVQSYPLAPDQPSHKPPT